MYSTCSRRPRCLALLSMILLVLSLLPAHIRAEGQAVVSLSAPSSVERGDPFTVTIRVQLSKPVESMQLFIKYDDQAFEYREGTAERWENVYTKLERTANGQIELKAAGEIPSGFSTAGQLTFKARGGPGGRIEVTGGSFSTEKDELNLQIKGAFAFVGVSGEGGLLPTESTTKETEPTTETQETEPGGLVADRARYDLEDKNLVTEGSVDVDELIASQEEQKESLKAAQATTEAAVEPVGQTFLKGQRLPLLVAMGLLLVVIVAMIFIIYLPMRRQRKTQALDRNRKTVDKSAGKNTGKSAGKASPAKADRKTSEKANDKGGVVTASLGQADKAPHKRSSSDPSSKKRQDRPAGRTGGTRKQGPIRSKARPLAGAEAVWNEKTRGSRRSRQGRPPARRQPLPKRVPYQPTPQEFYRMAGLTDLGRPSSTKRHKVDHPVRADKSTRSRDLGDRPGSYRGPGDPRFFN